MAQIRLEDLNSYGKLDYVVDVILSIEIDSDKNLEDMKEMLIGIKSKCDELLDNIEEREDY